jgi:pyrroline-5-carboxylate reductase
MGEALLGGLLSSGWAEPAGVLVVEPLESRRNELTGLFPGVVVVAELGAEHTADGALIAVKPNHVVEVCELIASRVQRVLSIAAGVPIAKMELALRVGESTRAIPVIRSMPNTPSLVGRGASAIAGGYAASADDLAWAESILSSVGIVERVDEKLLDAVTGLSGSGPAYIFMIAEAMIDAGVLVGLSRAVATSLAVQTILGAGTLLSTSGQDAATLRANVTSPGGTTAAGLRALEAGSVRSDIIDAVVAATNRAHELA